VKYEAPSLLSTHGLLFLTFGGLIAQSTCGAHGREEGPCLFIFCVKSSVSFFTWEQPLTSDTGFPVQFAEGERVKLMPVRKVIHRKTPPALLY